MNIKTPSRDGDGYLTDMNIWTPEVAYTMLMPMNMS